MELENELQEQNSTPPPSQQGNLADLEAENDASATVGDRVEKPKKLGKRIKNWLTRVINK